jgi:hypothetical protein
LPLGHGQSCGDAGGGIKPLAGTAVIHTPPLGVSCLP